MVAADTGRILAIRGGRPLVGTYPISGAKNAVLPLMVSALLTPHLVTLRNVPASLDVAVLAALLQRLGCELHWSATGTGPRSPSAPIACIPRGIDRELVARMRASVLLLGALLARCGQARLPMPGGDAIGLRGIDFHVAGLRAMGATVDLAGGVIERDAPRRPARRRDPPAAALGRRHREPAARRGARHGHDVIRNAAREPEVADLAACLVAMGAAIDGAGTTSSPWTAARALAGAAHAVMPDRIELGTLACAAAITDGDSGPAARPRRPARRRARVVRRRRGAMSPAAGGLVARRAPAACAPSTSRPAASRLRDRPAGADHGAAGDRRRRQHPHRDHLRAALPPRRRAAQAGRAIAVRGRTAMVRGVARLQAPRSPAPTCARRQRW